MAQYFLDPANGQAELDRFTLEHRVIGSSIQTHNSVPYFVFDRDAGLGGPHIVSFKELGQIADCEVVVRTFPNEQGVREEQGGPGVRISDTVIDAYGGSRAGNDGLDLNEYLAGVTTKLGPRVYPAAMAAAAGKSLYIRINMVGTAIKLKAWAVDVAEPAAWDIERTETAITNGFPGVVGVNRSMWIASFGLGTNGDPAPLEAVAATPTITDIDGDESVYPGQSFVITGTNFGATQGTGTVDIDGVPQTVTAWSDTSITCTAVRGGNEYGTGKTLTVTTDAGTTATLTVAQEAEPGTFAVTAASPNTTDDASLWTGLVDTATGDPVTVVDGDQAWVKTLLDGLAIAPDGTITANETGSFTVQFWKASEGVWGSDQTVSFTLPSEPSAPNIDLKKKQNKRRRYTANLLVAWRNRFIGEQDE